MNREKVITWLVAAILGGSAGFGASLLNSGPQGPSGVAGKSIEGPMGPSGLPGPSGVSIPQQQSETCIDWHTMPGTGDQVCEQYVP